MNSKINVVVMEPIGFYRFSMTEVLKQIETVNICTSVRSLSELDLLLSSDDKIDLVICDVYEKGENIASGIYRLRQIKKMYQRTFFIVFTQYTNVNFLVQSGADFYLSKTMRVECFKKTIAKRNITITKILKRSEACRKYNYLTEAEWDLIIYNCAYKDCKILKYKLKKSLKEISLMRKSIMHKLDIYSRMDYLRFISRASYVIMK